MTAAGARRPFGWRAEMERQGIPPEPEPEVEVEEPEPRPRSASVATVEVSVTPVLDQVAMEAVCDQIAEHVRAAFRRGVTEGLAEAEALLGDGE